MIGVARDRMTNTRRDRRVGEPCPTCHGYGALLPLPSGVAVCAMFVVPNMRAWPNLPVCPCPSCDQSGIEPRRGRPRGWGQG